MRVPEIVVLGSVLLTLPGCAAQSGGPALEGIDAPAIDALFAELRGDERRDIKGVLVVRDGEIAAEAYFNGDDADTLHDIRSAGKSVTSMLVGIAIDLELIAGVDQPIIQLLPPGLPPDKHAITLGHLLTMRAGLHADDRDPSAPGNEDRMDESDGWLAFAYATPMKWQPGERYVYSSLSAFLAGAVVEHATQMSLAKFAERHLFGPLDITRYSWRRGPRGEGAGQGNLRLRLRDMATLGELFRNGGSYRGKQVVSASWVRTSLSSIVPIAAVDPYAEAYGYMWYTKRHVSDGRSVLVHFASGNGGNKIYIVPELAAVIAITSSAYGRGYGQQRSERILLRILEALYRERRTPAR
jgi:CubicO group peptidase (beta-lactamase class C family)